jgi:hypothetical protein
MIVATSKTIDKQTGSLIQYSPNGHNLFCEGHGLSPNFIRAVTDNDRGAMELALNFMFIQSWAQTIWHTLYGYHDCSYASSWRSVGLDCDVPPKIVRTRTRVTDQSNQDQVCVVALCTIFSSTANIALMKVKLHYTFHGDGRAQISNHVKPLNPLRWVASLPRVGMNMVLDPSLYTIQYCGRGPYENYPIVKFLPSLVYTKQLPMKCRILNTLYDRRTDHDRIVDLHHIVIRTEMVYVSYRQVPNQTSHMLIMHFHLVHHTTVSMNFIQQCIHVIWNNERLVNIRYILISTTH